MKWYEVTTKHYHQSGNMIAKQTGVIESKQKPHKSMERDEIADTFYCYFRTENLAREFIRGT